MITEGYFDNRLKKLEKRKKELEKQYVTSRLSLKSIEREIEKCYDSMNSNEYAVFKKENAELKSRISELEDDNQKLREHNEKLEQRISNLISKKDFDDKMIIEAI